MHHKNALVKLLLAISFLAAGAAQAASENPVTDGRQLFEVHCMHCHGEKADGKGAVIDFLKIHPANLTTLSVDNPGCVTERVLKAVLGRHQVGGEEAKMPLLQNALTPEEIFFISEYIKSIQK